MLTEEEKKNIIKETEYDDRGCYNCKYRILQRKKDRDFCELHQCEVGIWHWCEGWEYS